MPTAATPATEKRSTFSRKGALDNFTIEKADNGNSIVKGIRFFKAGTFRDSWGIQKTFTREHLVQMASNFASLRDSKIFPNVPWRSDHSYSIEKVVGYFSDVRVEGDFLVGDIEFTDADAVEKFDRGKYRAVSAEIGMYEDNNDTPYWPVVMGAAFVDIPAVEGLYSKFESSARGYVHSEDIEKETTVPNTKDDTAENKPDPKPATFRIAGAESSDYAAVQAHIDELEKRVAAADKFMKDSKDEARKGFVTKLSADKKIAATQVEALTELALGLSDEQYAAFTKSYEGAPVLSLFGEHGGNTAEQGADAAKSDEIEVLEQTVEMFRRAGKSEDFIKNTPSFKKLQTLKGN